MRRNLTISFDSDFITYMDETRGGRSRGAWLEERSGAPMVDRITPATRSPAPQPESQPQEVYVGPEVERQFRESRDARPDVDLSVESFRRATQR